MWDNTEFCPFSYEINPEALRRLLFVATSAFYTGRNMIPDSLSWLLVMNRVDWCFLHFLFCLCECLFRSGFFWSGQAWSVLVWSGLVWNLSVCLKPIRRKQSLVFIFLIMYCTSFRGFIIITLNWSCDHTHGLIFWPLRPQSLFLTYSIYNLEESPGTVQTTSSSVPDCKQQFLTFGRNTFRRRKDKMMVRLTVAQACAVAFCVWPKTFCALDCL